MKENQLTIVRKYKINKPLIHRRDSIVDNCYRDCHDKIFLQLNRDVYMTLILKI